MQSPPPATPPSGRGPDAPGRSPEAPYPPGDAEGAAAGLAAARTGAAVVDAPARGCVRVRGGDAVDLLQRVLACDVRALGPGEGTAGVLLAPRGGVRFAFDLERDAGEVLLWTAPGEAAELAAALDAFVFGEDVAIDDATAEHAPLELLGPRAAAVLAEHLGCAPELPPRGWLALAREDGPLRASRVPVLGAPGWRLDAGPGRAAALRAALVACGATPLGPAAGEVLRVRNAVPLPRRELDGEARPQELGLDDAFSLAKGCYVGQEVVAKVDTYGGLHRRLVVLELAEPTPLPEGAALLAADGTEAGRVTSWAPALGGDPARALALLRLRAEAAGPFRVALGESAVAVTRLGGGGNAGA